jgi:hypothetical protein
LLKPGQLAACASLDLFAASPGVPAARSLATAAAYATAAQGVRPLFRASAADAVYHMETLQLLWTNSGKSRAAQYSAATATAVIACLQARSLIQPPCLMDAAVATTGAHPRRIIGTSAYRLMGASMFGT